MVKRSHCHNMEIKHLLSQDLLSMLLDFSKKSNVDTIFLCHKKNKKYPHQNLSHNSNSVHTVAPRLVIFTELEDFCKLQGKVLFSLKQYLQGGDWNSSYPDLPALPAVILGCFVGG